MAFGTEQLERLRELLLGAVVTQPFGPSNLTMEPAYGGAAHFHKGVDLVLPGGVNAPVPAPASGQVIFAGYVSGTGNTVKIQAANGYIYTLGHLSNLITLLNRNGTGPQPGGAVLQQGQPIRAGDLVGFQGSTGTASTGVHLHLQIERRDPATGALIPVNPGGLQGQSGNPVFGFLYHSLGLGAGYQPGQFDYQPEPGRLLFGVVPWPPPPAPNDPSGSGTPGIPVDPNEEQPGSSTPTATPVGWTGNPTDPGGLLGGLLSPATVGSAWVPVLRQVGGTLVIMFLGGVLIVVGLAKLGGEKPVQVVVQPAERAAKTAAKLAA